MSDQQQVDQLHEEVIQQHEQKDLEENSKERNADDDGNVQESGYQDGQIQEHESQIPSVFENVEQKNTTNEQHEGYDHNVDKPQHQQAQKQLMQKQECDDFPNQDYQQVQKDIVEIQGKQQSRQEQQQQQQISPQIDDIKLQQHHQDEQHQQEEHPQLDEQQEEKDQQAQDDDDQFGDFQEESEAKPEQGQQNEQQTGDSQNNSNPHKQDNGNQLLIPPNHPLIEVLTLDDELVNFLNTLPNYERINNAVFAKTQG